MLIRRRYIHAATLYRFAIADLSNIQTAFPCEYDG
jgi:hypothetical protein